MIQRCENPGHEAFAYYGGRGIAICAEWRQSFSAFRAWALANGYERGLTIDRVLPDGNYEPSNCRWATKAVQVKNRRESITSLMIDHRGRRMTLSSWSSEIGIRYTTLIKRFHNGLRGDQLFAPIDGRKSHPR